MDGSYPSRRCTAPQGVKGRPAIAKVIPGLRPKSAIQPCKGVPFEPGGHALLALSHSLQFENVRKLGARYPSHVHRRASGGIRNNRVTNLASHPKY